MPPRQTPARHRHAGPPIAIDPLIQKDEGDCALACLAMVSGRSYVDVRKATRRVCPDAPVEGASAEDLVRLGRSLKYPLVARIVQHGDDFEDLTGVLMVERKVRRRYHRHAVVLFQGVIIDPSDGTVWDFDAYMAELDWRPTVIVVPA